MRRPEHESMGFGLDEVGGKKAPGFSGYAAQNGFGLGVACFCGVRQSEIGGAVHKEGF